MEQNVISAPKNRIYMLLLVTVSQKSKSPKSASNHLGSDTP